MFCIQNTYGVNESKLPKILSYTISTHNELLPLTYQTITLTLCKNMK